MTFQNKFLNKIKNKFLNKKFGALKERNIFVKIIAKMDHIINISAMQEKLKDKPAKHRLYHFFMGVPGQLTREQAMEIKKVLNKEHKKMILFLDKVKTA